MLKVIGRILATVLLVTAALTIVGCRTRSYEVEVTYENGTVEGYGTYKKGETVPLTAAAAEGYMFDGWSGDFTEEDATLEFEMPGNDVSLTAHFVPAEYNVTVEYDSEHGAVEGYGTFSPGDTVELTATPSEGYEFAGWEGDRTGEETTLTFEMPTEDVSLEALFAAEIYNVHIDYDEEKGSVEGHGEIAYGETVVLTATPEEGYTFAEWTGDFTGDSETLEFSMPAEDVTIEAHFVPAIYTVSVTYDDSEGTVEGYGEIAYGETVVLTAIPETGYELEEWTGDFTGDSETLEFTMPAEDVEIEAHFAKILFSITVEYDTDKGTVLAPTEATYGQQVTLFAEPAEHHTFEGWTGDREGSFHSLTFTMPAEDVTIEALFEAKSFEVEVVYDDDRGTVEGYGEIKYNETVTLTAASKEGYLFDGWTGFMESDDKILTFTMPAEDIVLEAHFVEAYAITVNYDSDEGSVSGYEGKFAAGATVELTATPATGYAFDGWSGYLESDEETITFEMPAEDVEFSVDFAIVYYELTITTEGNGQVSGEGTYNYGDTVTIEATAASGWRFIEWSGDLSSSSAEFTFTMPAADIEIEALFKEVHTVNISYDDTKGSVNPEEPREYVEGERVTLEAVAKDGYKFYEWSGHVDTDRATITFTMPDHDVSLTATFVVADFTVTVDYDDDKGSVTGAGEYSYGADATLTATPKTGYEFVGWSGYKDSDQRTITIENITEDIHLVATFAPQSYDVNITYDADMGSVVGEGTYEFGEEVIVEAIPDTGYEFVEWTGDLTSTDRMFIFDMPAQDVTLEAVFAEIPTHNIADILAMDDGDVVRVEAVISSYRAHHRKFYIQDEDGTAINIFDDELFDEESLAIGNKIVIEGELDTYTLHGNDLRQLRNVTLVSNDGGDHPITVIDDKTIEDIVNTYPDNTSMRFRLQDVVISDIDPAGDHSSNFLLETGQETKLKFHFGSYGQHLLDILEVGDTIEWIEFTVHDLHFGEIRLEGVVFPELDDDLIEANAKNEFAIPDEVVGDLNMIELLEIAGVDYDRGPDVFDVVWTSSDESVIELDGTVHRPAPEEDDVDVDLTATITNGNGVMIVIDYEVTVLAELGDLINVFETGFEAEEGFTARTNYMGTHEDEGIDPYTWTFFFGTPSTTAQISGEQSAQMRWYKSHEDSFGYVQTNFSIPDVRLVNFSALGTGGNDVEVSYSYDGETWQGAVVFELGTSAQDFVYEINPSEPVYLRFKLVSDGVDASRVTLDDIIVEAEDTPAARDWHDNWQESLFEGIAAYHIAPPAEVTDDITLADEVTIFGETYSVAWESNNEDVIENDGTVHRPGPGEDDEEVVLTATLSNGNGEVHTLDFDVTVIAIPLKMSVADALSLDDGTIVQIEAVISSYRADADDREFFIQDEDGTAIFIYDGDLFDDESLDIGNKIIIEGELDTYTLHGNNLRQLRNVTLVDNDGGDHPITVIDDKTIEDIVNNYPANSSMRFRLEDVVISDIAHGDYFLETGAAEKLRFDFGSYGQHFVDILEVGDTIDWIEFTVYDIFYDHIRLEGVVFPELDEDMIEDVAKRDFAIPDEVYGDLNMIDLLEIEGVNYDRGPDTFDVQWTSSNTNVIETDGTVHRPDIGEPDVDVDLTATITDGNGVNIVIDYSVTVMAKRPVGPTTTETFAGIDNFAYDEEGTIEGDSGIEWSYVDLRKDSDDYGDFVQMRATEPSRLEASFEGGLDSLTVDTMAFGGGRSFDIIINEGEADEIVLTVENIGTDMLTKTFENLGVEGEFTITITNMSNPLKIYQIEMVHQPED